MSEAGIGAKLAGPLSTGVYPEGVAFSPLYANGISYASTPNAVINGSVSSYAVAWCNPVSLAISAPVSPVALAPGSTSQIVYLSGEGNTVSFASSNTAVATVTDSGLVTGVGSGNATITITASNCAGATVSKTLTFLVQERASLEELNRLYPCKPLSFNLFNAIHSKYFNNN